MAYETVQNRYSVVMPSRLQSSCESYCILCGRFVLAFSFVGILVSACVIFVFLSDGKGNCVDLFGGWFVMATIFLTKCVAARIAKREKEKLKECSKK